MRTLARALRQVNCSPIRRGLHVSTVGLNKNHNFLILKGLATYSLSNLSQSFQFRRSFEQTTVFTRALSTSAENVSTQAAMDAEKSGPLFEYDRRIELVHGDNFQVNTLQLLQRLYEQLIENEDVCQLDRYKASGKAGRSRWLWSQLIPLLSNSPVKGLYLYRGVGTGKTMLMDLFYDHLPSDWRKRRIHFHDFMLSVHSRFQMHKRVADPLEVVAGEISDESILLCLDEFMVNDVADALILNGLFGHLFSKGVLVLVSMSNRAPDNLYEGSLQRDLFLPFIATLKERCVIHEIGSSTDYRKMTSAEQGFYFVGHESSELLKQKYHHLIEQESPVPQVVEVVVGRKLQVPQGANGCAYFPFEELCNRPLEEFHTLALEGMPKFGLHNRTAAYRFVTLVDYYISHGAGYV